jgi:hypothetical protein
VTKDEASQLLTCIWAVSAIFRELHNRSPRELWPDEKTYPLVLRQNDPKAQYKIELVNPVPPREPALPVARLQEEELVLLRNQDYAINGVLEIDYILSTSPIGEKNERKAMTCLAMALDAATGMILANEVETGETSLGDLLARVLVRAIRNKRTLPREIHVRNQRVRDSLLPFAESLGILVDVPRKLRAFHEVSKFLIQSMNL